MKKNRSSVDNGHTRHKCSVCKKVRYKRFMRNTGYTTRYQNDMWICVDNPDSEHSKPIYAY